MENKLSAVAALPEMEPAQTVKPSPPVRRPTPVREPPPAAEPDLRLIIEESGQAGIFVYKTIDRRTGEVILQLPRAEVLKMRDAEAYEAGAVIATQA